MNLNWLSFLSFIFILEQYVFHLNSFDSPYRKLSKNGFISLWKTIVKLKTVTIRELEMALTKFLVDGLYKPWSCHLQLPSILGTTYYNDLNFVSPIDVSAATGNVALFKILIEKLQVKDFIKPLKHAARNGNLNIFHVIMKYIQGKIQIDSENLKSWTLVHYSAEGGNLTICQKILEYADIKNPMNSFGITPLHVAAQNGHDSVYRQIMNYVVDKNPDNSQYPGTPLHMAARQGHLDVCLTIMKQIEYESLTFQNGQTPLHEAARSGHLNVCQVILEQIEDKNPANSYGITPLNYAYQYKHKEVFDLIIANVRDKNPKAYRVRDLGHTLTQEWINGLKCRYHIGGQHVLKQPLMAKAKPKLKSKIPQNLFYGSFDIFYYAFHYLFEFLCGNH